MTWGRWVPAFCLLAACSRERPLVTCAPEVRVWGSLRAIMHEGKTGASVSLAEAAGAHVYAVGALSGLRGEVLVIDGQSFTATGRAGAVHIQQTTADDATLLVAAVVPGWRKVPISRDIPAGEIDARVEEIAREAGIDVDQAFPVLIEGNADVDWHVLDGAKVPAGGGHADHLRNAVTGRLKDRRATIAGFFSKRHQTVFTHMGQHTHFHVLTPDRAVMGHVDALTVRAGSTLSLPARPK
jgi:acetolactate decarboxylase